MEKFQLLTMSMKFAEQTDNKGLQGGIHNEFGVYYHAIGQYDKAIEHFELYLTISREIEDKEGEGTAYGNLGACYKSLSQFDKAIKYLEMHLTIAKETGDKNEGIAYGNLGTCYSSLGQFDKAIKYLQKHLTIAKEIGDKKGEGTAYGNIGTCYSSLGQYHKAMKYLEKHLTIAKEIGDKRDEGTVYGNLGSCCSYLGKYNKAIKYLEMHLTIAKEIGDKKGEGTAYGNLGTCHKFLGHYRKVVSYFEKQLTILKRIGDKEGEGVAYGNLGTWYTSLGQYDKAIKCLEMRLGVAKEIGDKKGEGAANGNLGSCYYYLGQFSKAIAYYEMRLTIAKEMKDQKGIGTAYGRLGACYTSLGQYDKAISYLQICLHIAKEIENKNCEGDTYGSLGVCYSYLGQHDSAIKHLEIQLTITKEIGDKEGEGTAYGNLGKSYILLGQFDKAERNLRKAIECYTELYENAPMMDEYKVSFIDMFIDIYKLLTLTLLSQEKTDEGLVIAEKGRSRALASLIINTDLDQNPVGTIEANVSDIREVREVVKALESTVFFFVLPTLHIFDVSTWVIQPNGNLFYDRRCTKIQVQYWKLHTHDISLMINEAIKLITSCGAVRCEDRSLSFLYGEEESEPTKNIAEPLLACNVAKIDLNDPHAAYSSLPEISHPTMNQERKELRTAASVGQEGVTRVPANHTESKEAMLRYLLEDLYQILLEPVRQHVLGSQVIVVPDGLIALVPFAALLDENGNYVSESLQVRLIPSLTTAKMIIERPEHPGRKGKPLIIGDPEVGEVVMDGKVIPVPKLDYARTEVEMVGQLLSADQLVGERATKARFLRRVENASLIHIAAHGHAKRGKILLAPGPGTNGRNIKDVMLTITDLERKCIKAKLVVLSCCHSGRGKVRAEGVIGIARAFLGAGARAVVATLWAVDDGATLCFMYHFYKHLIAGESASEALNGSMKAIRELKNFSHPRYWAPFVLMGDDVTLFDKKIRH